MLQPLRKITVSGKKLAVQGEITAARTSSMALGRYVAAAGKCGLAAGSVCSAAGKKDFLAFGKKVAAVGKCVQLPGMFILRKGKCNTGKRFSFSGPILVVRLVLPCNFISLKTTTTKKKIKCEKKKNQELYATVKKLIYVQ